jgi:peptide/nickel transport system substrate-binding protein
MSISVELQRNNTTLAQFLASCKFTCKQKGIDFNIENLDYTSMVNKVLDMKADMWFLSWGLTSDPSAVGSMFVSDGSLNVYGYKNAKVDEYYRLGKVNVKLSERKQAYQKAYQLLNEEIPCMPIYQREDLWLINGRIKGVNVSSYRSVFCDFYQLEIG